MIKKRMNHEAIFQVACVLKPIYDVQQARYIDCINDPDNFQKMQNWSESIEAYHRALMRHARTLGKATTIGGAAIKILMGVRGTIIVWTPEWLRNIANYERINPNYWVHPKSVKVNNYEFTQEISPE